MYPKGGRRYDGTDYCEVREWELVAVADEGKWLNQGRETRAEAMIKKQVEEYADNTEDCGACLLRRREFLASHIAVIGATKAAKRQNAEMV